MPAEIKLQANLIDRFVGMISPAAMLRRLQYRAATQHLRAHYEGGSTGRRTAGWRTPSTGPTAAGAVTLTTLRNRSRDLVRNNPWARNAVGDLVSEIVGTGIRAKVKGRNARATKAIAERWKLWSESTQCDSNGQLNLYGLQALVGRTVAESGEALIRFRARRPSDGLAIPMQLQVLEPDHLDASRDTYGAVNQARTIGGIEFDALGRRVAYWLFPEHPGESFGVTLSQVSVRVPADQVLHVYEIERAGQLRGIPWGASAVVRIRDFDEYEDAQLVRQKIAACFAAFVTKPDGGTPAILTGLPETDDSGKAKPPTENVTPGLFQELTPGQQITFASPPGVEGYDTYSTSVLRAIAAGFGTTYEAVSGDYSKVNFSSARLGWIRHNRRVEAWRWNLFIPRLCEPIARRVLELLDVMGLDVQGATVAWAPPRRDLLDPKTEIVSTRTEIRAGLKSLSAAIRERGDEPDEVFAELAEDQERMDELGLILESDARRPSNGQPGDPAAAAANPGAKPADGGDGEGEVDDEETDEEEEKPAKPKRKAAARARRPS